MATNEKTEGAVLYIAAESADTPDGPIAIGEIAEAAAKVVKKYPLLFKPLTITYKA